MDRDTDHLVSFIEGLRSRSDIGENIVYHRHTPPVAPRYADLPAALHPTVKDALIRRGLGRLYAHQAEAIRAALAREDVIVATPTASGKTLCYAAPVLSDLTADREGTALFLFPLKALARDQIDSFRRQAEGIFPAVTAEIYDGDVSPHVRSRIVRRPPQVLFTNPDMLHVSLLAHHAKWEGFFSKLKTVVVDEAHTYRGVFGSHVAQVIRRLLRIAARYGAKPRFALSSATIANPGAFAEKLTGRRFTVVADNAAPKSGAHFLVYTTDGSPYTDASKLFRAAVGGGYKTIVFTKARKITELIYQWTVQAEPELAGRVASYRAGFLATERRQIERDLFGGKIDGVVSTSALEMGVDIGGLDVCILVGYPGAMINLWQRAGRVGRGGSESLIILVAQPDPLDQHFVKHPNDLFDRGYEEAIVDPDNKEIVAAHMVCAAAEGPLEPDDPWFTPNNRAPLMERLLAEKRLVRSLESGRYLSPRIRPHRFVDIRSVGETYTIFAPDGKTIIGTQSGGRVFKEAHEGAVYLHRGRQYTVTGIDIEKRAVIATPTEERYYTRARSDKETEILEVLDEKRVNGFAVKLGRLKVTEQVTGYEKRAIYGQESLGVFPLDLPQTEFETVGFWVEIDDPVRLGVEEKGRGYMGGIHAFEHGAIALFPLFALCDRDDIGGISYPHYPALGKSAVFFYDGYPGGVGLCEAGYAKVTALWDATLKLIDECPCDAGCPSCIQSPKCGSGNKPLDKEAATAVLRNLAGKERMKIGDATRRMVPPPPRIIKEPTVTNERQQPDPAPDTDYYDPAPARRVVFFDLETQRAASDVGGWNNTHRMGLAVAVVYDSREKRYTRYWEADADALVEKLLSADLVVGFNHIQFDYGVMRGYTDIDLAAETRSFDIMKDVWSRLGHRLSLGALATATLGRGKTADGLQSLIWWADGEREKVADYCQVDVEVTKELFEYGLERHHLIYTHKSGERVKIENDWDLETIIRQAAAAKPKPRPRKLRF